MSAYRRTRALRSTVAALSLLLFATSAPVYALGQGSTMSEWSQASAADRQTLLDAIGPGLTPSFKARAADIMACLNLAAQGSAHADLPVREIAKACAEAAEAPSDAGPSNDI